MRIGRFGKSVCPFAAPVINAEAAAGIEVRPALARDKNWRRTRFTAFSSSSKSCGPSRSIGEQRRRDVKLRSGIDRQRYRRPRWRGSKRRTIRARFRRLPSAPAVNFRNRLWWGHSWQPPSGAYFAPAPPIYKLEALPADGMGATAAEWWGLRHAPVAALRQTYAASQWKGRGRSHRSLCGTRSDGPRTAPRKY